jgi:uncharacterized membrane protein
MSFSFITKARMDGDKQPLPPVKSKGVKWAVISAIAVIAATILAATIVVGILMAAFTFASGVGAPFGILHLAGAITSVGLCVEMCLIARECILNAKHHLAKPKGLNVQAERLENPAT